MVFVLLFIFVFALFVLLCFHTAYYSSPKRKEDPRHIPRSEQYQQVKEGILAIVDYVDSYPYESVSIRSRDGLKLAARYYQVHPGAPVVIILHGYRSTSLRDGAGMFKLAMEQGFNVLLPDMRSHGQSEGRVITLGILERFDCVDWVNYILRRCGADTPILVSGCSMGAATVMMSAELLPPQVKGIACDCGYTSPKAIMQTVCKQMHLLAGPAYFFLRLSARIFGGFDPDSCTSLSSLAHSSIPALFIHGEADHYVPCSMVYENFEACAAQTKMLLTVPEAGHGLSFLVDEAAYRKAVFEFMEKIGLLQ